MEGTGRGCRNPGALPPVWRSGPAVVTACRGGVPALHPPWMAGKPVTLWPQFPCLSKRCLDEINQYESCGS